MLNKHLFSPHNTSSEEKSQQLIIGSTHKVKNKANQLQSFVTPQNPAQKCAVLLFLEKVLTALD